MSNAAPARDFSEHQPDYYAWSFPGMPVRVHLKLSLVPGLRDQVNAGLHNDGKESVETGGLLLGATHAGAVEITDFCPFTPQRPSRHFILSETERARLRTVIAERLSSGNAAQVVGYFRSDVREGIRLYPEDLELIQDLFADPTQVFLILSAEDNCAATAGFFFWDNGVVFGDASFMPFPLDEHLLAAARPSSSALTYNPPEPQPDPVPGTEAGLPAIRPKSRLRVAAAVLAVALGSGFAGYYLLPGPAPRPNTSVAPPISVASPMSLSASRSDSEVVITWNPQVEAVANARVGVLTIKDGNLQKDIPLTKNQLQMHRIVYAPVTDQIEASLEVFPADGKPARESIMFVFSAQTGRSESAGTPSVTRVGVKQPLQQRKEPGPVREFTPPSSADGNQRPAQNVALGTPPALDVRSAAPSPRNASAGAPVEVLTVPPPGESQLDGQTSSGTAAAQPARALRQVRPVVPTNLNAMLKRRVDVQVRVRVDETGKVISAQPLVSPGPLTEYLGKTAADAARLWTFQPARSRNTNIASDLVLQFSFGPGQ